MPMRLLGLALACAGLVAFTAGLERALEEDLREAARLRAGNVADQLADALLGPSAEALVGGPVASALGDRAQLATVLIGQGIENARFGLHSRESSRGRALEPANPEDRQLLALIQQERAGVHETGSAAIGHVQLSPGRELAAVVANVTVPSLSNDATWLWRVSAWLMGAMLLVSLTLRRGLLLAAPMVASVGAAAWLLARALRAEAASGALISELTEALRAGGAGPLAERLAAPMGEHGHALEGLGLASLVMGVSAVLIGGLIARDLQRRF